MCIFQQHNVVNCCMNFSSEYADKMEFCRYMEILAIFAHFSHQAELVMRITVYVKKSEKIVQYYI